MLLGMQISRPFERKIEHWIAYPNTRLDGMSYFSTQEAAHPQAQGTNKGPGETSLTDGEALGAYIRATSALG